MCKLPKQSNLYLVIFIVVAVLVGGFFYFQKDLGFDFWEGDGVGEESNIVVEELESGEKSVRNVEEGYEFIVNKDVDIETNGQTILFYEDVDKTLPEYTLETFNNNLDLTLEEWLERYHEEVLLIFFDEREKISLNGLEFYKIKQEGDPTTFSYYFSHNNKIFVLTSPEPEDVYGMLDIFSSLN